jgi:hypothetical protein
MLVLRRREGDWVEITHTARGDKLRVRVFDIGRPLPGRAQMAFDDAARNFEIERPERIRPAPEPGPAESLQTDQ